ncbi:ABC transporter ATP-binding protein [uncultured Massilia sp.]|uniref:ABC transporter ATP-binding protein n=1 Tax=uncultured Massilia sp. TaxID=169973 RepID=UPI0025E50E6E|nr:ABC transporter ATP-binding protein [uncultured Massilia sp.]
MTRLLEIAGLRAGYRDAVVIDDLALAMDAGESLALLGRNGVGKSTLLATLMGLTTMSRGSIRLQGSEIAALASHRRNAAGLGYVPQEREIFASLSVEQNLRVALRPGPWNVAQVYDLFPRLEERRANFGNQLSGGEQQMLAMGRALVGNPRLLLLDEPLEGLSPIMMDVLLDAIKALKDSGLALVLVEQHAHMALEVTDRVVVLDRGRIVHQGTSAAFLADEAHMGRLLGLAQEDSIATD